MSGSLQGFCKCNKLNFVIKYYVKKNTIKKINFQFKYCEHKYNFHTRNKPQLFSFNFNRTIVKHFKFVKANSRQKFMKVSQKIIPKNKLQKI